MPPNQVKKECRGCGLKVAPEATLLSRLLQAIAPIIEKGIQQPGCGSYSGKP